MGERSGTLTLETPPSIIGYHPEANITRPSLEDWIFANPRQARRKATEHLSPQVAQIFTLGLEELSNSEIAQQLGISPRTVGEKIHESFIQLIQAEKLDPELKRGVFRRVQLRDLLNGAKGGSISSTLRLIDHCRRSLDNNTHKLSPERRPDYVFEVIKEVIKNIVEVSWQNPDTIDNFLYQTFYYTRLQQDRNKHPKKVSGKAPRMPFLNDFLRPWLDEHPQDEKRLMRLLGLKRPWARDVFIATRMGLRPQQIKELFPGKTINNIKVSLSHARNFLERESGITLPKGWQPISVFTQFGLSKDQIYSAVEKGKIDKTMLFRGATHLLESDFQRYLEQKVESEQDLVIQNAIEGKENARRMLLTAYFPRVYRYCLVETGNEQNALAAAEDVLSEIANKIDQFPQKNSFNVWLFSLAYQVIGSRRQKAQTQTTPVLGNDTAVDHEFQEIQKLPKDQRHVLALRFAIGLPTNEISQVLKKSEKEIKRLQFEGISRLSRRFEKQAA